MISTGPNGSKAFFMANIWSGSSSNLSAASRAFQHKPLKSPSEESLNHDLLSPLNMDNSPNTKRHDKLMRKRYKSQNDADDLSERDFVLSDEQMDNWLHDNDGSDCDLGDGSGQQTRARKSKCDSPRKATKRNADLKKTDKSKQQNDLLTSILDDTEDIDQMEYFDDNEIYSKTISATENGSTVQADSSNKQSSKSSENVATELLRVLSIKSASMWWRWNNKDSAMAKESADQPEMSSKSGGNSLIEIEMNPMGTTNGETSSLGSRTEAIISKLKNFAKIDDEKKKLEKFIVYNDEPKQSNELVILNEGSSEIYKVKDNQETLRSIAARYKTTPAEIKSLNHLSQDHIFVGQLLLIPLIVETKLVPEKKSDK